jgi:hypothetical protein
MQFLQGDAVFLGAIGTFRARLAAVCFILVVVGSFAEARRNVGASCRGTRGTIWGAGRTLGFGGFAGFVQIGIDVTFFAGDLAAKVLVLPGWAIGTCAFRTAVRT